MREYKVLLPVKVHTEDGAYAQGETFGRDDGWAAEHEAANLASGLLELQPARYKITGNTQLEWGQPGDEFEAAIPYEREQLLADHIERVEDKPKPKTRKKEA